MVSEREFDCERVMEWIRERREELQLSQKDLTHQLQLEGIDIGQSILSAWENGRYRPPLEDARFRRAIARVLRLSVRDVLRRSGYDVGDTSHTEEAEQGAHIIDQLPDDKRRIALKLLEALL